MGVLLRTRTDVAPSGDVGFVVADAALSVQAVSARAEAMLGVREVDAVNRHLTELLIPADAEALGPRSLAEAITFAASGVEEPMQAVVRPAGMFGIRLPVRIAACGPPAAALLVLG